MAVSLRIHADSELFRDRIYNEGNIPLIPFPNVSSYCFYTLYNLYLTTAYSHKMQDWGRFFLYFEQNKI